MTGVGDGVMWKILLVLFLLVVAPTYSERRRRYEDDEQLSNELYKEEFYKIAGNLREKLREELSKIEMEMYNDFLGFLEQFEVTQDVLSKEVSTKLAMEVEDILIKFRKVMVYSNERRKNFNDRLEQISDSLGIVLKPAPILDSDYYEREYFVSGERGKRHAIHVDEARKSHSYLVSRSHDDISVDDSSHSPLPFDELMGSLETDDDFLHFENLLSNMPYPEDNIFQDGSDMVPIKREDIFQFPKNCYDLLTKGHVQDGIYTIYPTGGGNGVEVWCDQTSDGGGWTVIVGRRPHTDPQHAHVNFSTPADHYIHGFGHPDDHHWIGLEVMNALTHEYPNTLRVILKDHNGTQARAFYANFSVGSGDNGYPLTVEGYDPSSTAGDALSLHSGALFSPLGNITEECSQELGAGWWFLAAPTCYQTLPTGEYRNPNDQDLNRGGLEWLTWRGEGHSLRSLLMMIKPHL